MVGSIAAGLMLVGIVGTSVQIGTPSERARLLQCGDEGHKSFGTLLGTISDASGGRIAGASIVASCGSFRQTFITGSAGEYRAQLPPGECTLSVTAERVLPGKAQIRVPGAGPAVVLNFTLTVEQLRVNVVVTATERYPVATTATGSKAETSLSDVPQSITVVDRALLHDQNAQKLDDALKNVAGVMPGGFYEPWDGYRIRGFDASFTTYLDGLRGGNGMGEEMFGLESVEVLKGPSSTLYGSSIPGGLVNLRSKLPRPEPFAEVQFTTGSHGSSEPAIDAGAPLNRTRTLYGRINLLYRSTDSFVDYANRRRTYVAPALTWLVGIDTRLTFLGRYQHDYDHMGFPLPANGTVIPNPNGEIPVTRFTGEPSNRNPVSEINKALGYQLEHRFSDAIALYQNVRADWYDAQWDRLLYPGFLGSDKRTFYRYPLSYRSLWNDYAADTGLRLAGRLAHVSHRLVTGVDYYSTPRRFSEESIDLANPTEYMPLDLFHPVYGTAFPPMRPLASGHTRTQSVGVYLQDHVELLGRLSVIAGGRMDFDSNRDFSAPKSDDDRALSPRVGATYRVVAGATVYAGYSTSFRPQSGTVFDGSASGAFADPETGSQWESGLKTSLLSSRMINTVALYRLTRANVLTPDPSHPGFSLLTGKQLSTVVDVESMFQLHRTWNLTISYALTDAHVVNDTMIPQGTPTPNVPKRSVNVWSTYEMRHGWLNGLGFGGGARHYSEQSGDPQHTFSIPAYGLVEAAIFYRRGHFHWQFNASNLANKRYYTGSYNDLYVQPGSPRSVRTTLTWTLGDTTPTR